MDNIEPDKVREAREAYERACAARNKVKEMYANADKACLVAYKAYVEANIRSK
jgi:hypothetical protein